MDADEAIEVIGRAVDRSSATVLVGAGLSRGANYPTWAALLAPFRAEFGLSDDDDVDLPLLAQYVAAGERGRERLVNHVIDSINAVTQGDAHPTENHRLVTELPIDELWTTNYDPMLELVDSSLCPIESDDDFVRADLPARRLHKMHGSIRPGRDTAVEGPGSIVITRDDYDQYESLHPRAWALLRAQFLTRSFLFLGFSLTDPNFEAIFRLVRTATPDRFVDHVALLSHDDSSPKLFQARCDDLARSGVHVVRIDDYLAISDFLRRLVARTRPQRLYLSGSPPKDAAGSDNHDAGNANDRAPYPTRDTDADLASIVERLGVGLADAQLKVAAGSEVCADAVYSMLRARGEVADPDEGWILRRERDAALDTPPNRRMGTIRFIGSNPSAMRDDAFDQIRAVLVVGGGDGTRDEVVRARDRGMSVVPLAITGGTAHETWTEMLEDLDSHTIGGRPIDPMTFHQLNSADIDVAVTAAIVLARAALFADR